MKVYKHRTVTKDSAQSMSDHDMDELGKMGFKLVQVFVLDNERSYYFVKEVEV